MDLQTIIALVIAGFAAFILTRKKSDSKDAVAHATNEATLLERQKNKEAELKKTNKELEKIEESMKGMTPEEIEKYWDKK